MPPNPDVLQIRIGALVSLVIVRDREAQEYKVVIAEHGLCSKRYEVPLPPDQARRVGDFMRVPIHARVDVGGIVEVPMEDDPTRPG